MVTSKIFSRINNLVKTVVPGYSKAETFADRYIRDTVVPIRASILYCDLRIGPMKDIVEHTGIYIGNERIVELQGKAKRGKIRITNKYGFLKNTGFHEIRVACYGSG